MTALAQACFWTSAALAAHAVIGYPLWVALAGRFTRREVRRGAVTPSVDIVIPVHDGEAEIAEKLRNCLELEYPEAQRTVWVISDGSTDRTPAIADGFRDQGIRCLAVPERVGKVAAQNRLVPRLSAEIVVFTDVSIRVRPDALRLLVSNFADPVVGVVSCRDQVLARTGSGNGEGLYIRYDMAVRRYTTRVGSLIGVTGGFYGVRRELTRGGWDPSYPPDFHAALCAIENGYRAAEDERVLAFYPTAPSHAREFERKVRTMSRGMWALWGHRRLLNPLRYGWTALHLIHYKLLRWLMPYLLLALYLSTAWLASWAPLPYLPLWLAQTTLVLLGCLGLAGTGRARPLGPLTRGPAFVVLFNLALLLSWRNLVVGRRFVVWEPTPRS